MTWVTPQDFFRRHGNGHATPVMGNYDETNIPGLAREDYTSYRVPCKDDHNLRLFHFKTEIQMCAFRRATSMDVIHCASSRRYPKDAREAVRTHSTGQPCRFCQAQAQYHEIPSDFDEYGRNRNRYGAPVYQVMRGRRRFEVSDKVPGLRQFIHSLKTTYIDNSRFGYTVFGPIEMEREIDAFIDAQSTARDAYRDKKRDERRARQAQENDYWARYHATSNLQGRDDWDVLGLRPGADQDSIRAAYLNKAKTHHPDMGGTVADMQRVNQAYQSLSTRH